MENTTRNKLQKLFVDMEELKPILVEEGIKYLKERFEVDEKLGIDINWSTLFITGEDVQFEMVDEVGNDYWIVLKVE